jgi:tRNA U34 5-methylaminomethyl-2-thiouridine-forming methyltransferase MnmC
VAAGQKKACDKGWSIVLIDESGFMLQPVVRRTWAPKGQTPIQYSWDRHDRLSVIAGLTVSPVRGRLGVYFQVHDHNVRFEEVMTFLRLVHRQLGRKFILVLDRYSAHRKAVRLLQEAGVDWFEVEWLPSYAPDLNPVEMLWNHTKYADLANFIPDDIHHLHQAVNTSISDTRKKQDLARSFFKHAGLVL